MFLMFGSVYLQTNIQTSSGQSYKYIKGGVEMISQLI